MRERLERDLQAIGLSEKETRVYLAALSLGPTTAQTLAAKSTINRPTTYIMIESLVKRGLMSAVQKGKKRYFTAAEPEQLLELMAGQRKELQKKEELARQMLPDLAALARGNSGKTAVRIFEGKDVFSALQRDILASGEREIYDIATATEDGPATPVCLRGELRQEILKTCRVTSLQTGTASPTDKHVTVRTLDSSTFPLQGEAVFYGTKAFLVSHARENVSVLIDDRDITATLIVMHQALQNAATAK